MITLLLVMASATLPPQDVGASKPDSARVEELRSRIHGLRTSLLLGGERVRQAESGAVEFYDGKLELIAQRMDQVDAELAEKRATYELALERTLDAESPPSRQAAVEEASRLRDAISELESESGQLTRKRGGLSRMIAAVRSRQRERSRLAAQLETSGAAGFELDFPLPSVGLAPAAVAREASAVLENDGLVEDLLRRDPRRARRALFETDPARYWERFPLSPPLPELWSALAFPAADLPGMR